MHLKAALAIAFAIALPLEASAQARPEQEVRGGGWITTYWIYNTALGRQRICAFQSGAPLGSLAFSVSYAQDLPANEQTLISYMLINTAWQLAEAARGNVTLRIGANTRTVAFTRSSPTTMGTGVVRDATMATFISPLLQGEPMVVTLPNGETQTITGPRQDGTPNFLGQRLECMLNLLVTDPPPSNNPFGGTPNPPAPVRDPFAPAR